MPGIELTFEVFSAQEQSVLGPAFKVENAPDWLSVATHSRAEKPELFQVPPAWLVPASGESKVAIENAQRVYLVVATPGERPKHDAHLQFGIQVAGHLAKLSHGAVVDRLARRVLDAAQFAKTLQPGASNHFQSAFDPAGHTRTWGMTKFGLSEVGLDTKGVDPKHTAAALKLLDGIASGLVARKFTADKPFTLAGKTWKLAKKGELLEAATDVELARALR